MFEGFELLARVATGLFQLTNYVSKGRHANFGSYVLWQMYCVAFVFIADKVGNSASLVLGHALNYRVAFGVNGRIVEWILSIANAQESSTLLIGRRSQSWHLEQLGARGESTMFATIVNNVLGQCGAKSTNVHKQVLRGGVKVNSN